MGNLEHILKKYKDFTQDISGSVMPLISAVIIIIIMVGTVNISLIMMHRDRLIVRNALDAGITAALALHARELHVDLEYKQGRPCLIWHSQLTSESGGVCDSWEYCDSWDEYDNCDGWSTAYSYEQLCVNEDVCQHYQYQNIRGNSKNYIHINRGLAENSAREYFIRNIQINDGIDVNTIRRFSIDIRYDDQRTFDVYKNRPRMIDERILQELLLVDSTCSYGCPTTGMSSTSYIAVGEPKITNTVTNAHEDFESWWLGEARGFAGADTGSWSPSPAFSGDPIETIEDVLFPRWVELTGVAEVEIQIPFGRYVGRDTFPVRFEVVAFRELAYAYR